MIPAGAVLMRRVDRRVLARLIELRRSGGRTSMQSLSDEIGVSTNTVFHAVHRLEDEGLVATKPLGALRALVDVLPALA